jgi:hypothetical protein
VSPPSPVSGDSSEFTGARMVHPSIADHDPYESAGPMMV